MFPARLTRALLVRTFLFVTPPRTEQRTRLLELAALFLRLGFTAFGGPAAHIALMEHEIVRRRGWIDRQHFLDMVAAVNFVPGPNSTELAIHIGMIRAGTPGLIVAGVCFITPAVLIILPIAWMYITWGSLPQAGHVLSALNAAVVGIVTAALWRFATLALRNHFTIIVAAFAAVAGFTGKWFPQYQPDLVILACAAICGALYAARHKPADILSAALPLALSTPTNEFLRIVAAFLKIGATLFGSGYLLVSYLEQTFVEQHGWLTHQQLLDAFAVGQITPGPLLTTATFIGYVLGQRLFGTGGAVAGAVSCTIAIFLPSFILIAIFGRFLPAIRANPYARGALDAVNAAVVALIGVVLLRLAQTTLAPNWRLDWVNLVLVIATAFLLIARNINSTWLVGFAALLGLIRTLLF